MLVQAPSTIWTQVLMVSGLLLPCNMYMRLSAQLPPPTRTPFLTSLTGKAIGSGFTPIMHLHIKPVELDLLGESHGPVTRCVRGSFLARPGNMDRALLVRFMPVGNVPSGLSLYYKYVTFALGQEH